MKKFFEIIEFEVSFLNPWFKSEANNNVDADAATFRLFHIFGPIVMSLEHRYRYYMKYFLEQKALIASFQ
jgi:hypothetical protein